MSSYILYLHLKHRYFIMKTPGIKWQIITRKYYGDAWVKNELGVMNTMIKQQEMLPISVEQARAQVQRLKDQSQSAAKKGHS